MKLAKVKEKKQAKRDGLQQNDNNHGGIVENTVFDMRTGAFLRANRVHQRNRPIFLCAPRNEVV